jgi:hypothetical protein
LGDFGYILGYFGFFCFCIGILIGWFSSKRRKKNMNMKDMITFGSVVKFRDGRLAVALRDIDPKENHNTYKFYGLKDLTPSTVSINGIISLDAYNNDLNNKECGELLSRYDIMAIAAPVYCAFNGSKEAAELIKIMFGFVSEDDIVWTWKREDVIEVTMDAVEKKFGCKVKIVKEEN